MSKNGQCANSRFICESRTIIPELITAYEKAVERIQGFNRCYGVACSLRGNLTQSLSEKTDYIKQQGERIERYKVELEKVSKAYEKAVGMLKVMEFDVYSSLTGCLCCSFCQKTRLEGHAPDCELKKILGVLK